jgi:pSer/pThr/pTyr-binding forkhead associated (FHA) protein
VTDLVGRTIGDYRIEAFLGDGSVDQQFDARHTRLDRPVLLRLIDSRLGEGTDFSARFLNELRAVAALRAPHIVDIYDFGEQDGRCYIAQERTSSTLRELLQAQTQARDPLGVLDLVGLIRQAADGLATAHARGVVHGAIKPASLFVQRDTGVILKVGDFGVARLAAQTPLLMHVVLPAYMSPEQALGEPIDASSDIYSLGAVLYEVATGYVPFDVRTFEEARTRHINSTPTPPRLVRPQLPADLEAVIMRCLARRPEERFASMAELSSALQQVIRDNSPAQTQVLGGMATQQYPLPSVPEQATVVAMPPVEAAPGATVRAAVPAGGPRLRALDMRGTVLAVLDVGGAGATIGRGPANALVLEDAEISLHHARVDWNGAQATVTDLGSTNGTMLGATRLTPHTPRGWRGVEPLRIGPFRLQLELPNTGSLQETDPLLANLLNNQATVRVPAATPIPAVAAPSGSIIVRLEQEQLLITPGEPAVVRAQVVNQTTVDDYVSISVEGVPGAWVRGPEQALRLAPGEQTLTTLSILAPREAESLAGDYAVTVRARSGVNMALSGMTRGRWTVRSFAATSLTLTPRKVAGARSASYQVLLRNDGNVSTAYQMTVEDESGEQDYYLSQDQVALDPGQAANVTLTVEAPSRWVGNDELRDFTVTANAAGAATQSTDGQFIHRALVSPLLALVSGALLIALGFLVGSWLWSRNNAVGVVPGGTPTPTLPIAVVPSETAFPTATPTTQPGAPVINRFSAEPAVVAPGGTVNLSWDVSGATRVVIEQFGDVEPIGTLQLRANETTDFRLVASSGDLESFRIARVVVQPPTVAATASPLPPTPTPTPIPPTATPIPPSATAVPPTATPLPTATPIPPTLDLQALAGQASWRTDAGQLTFGSEPTQASGGAWVIPRITLEDGTEYQNLLHTVPTTNNLGFVEGSYVLPAIQGGQHFLAEVGLGTSPDAAPVQIQIIFNDQLIFERVKTPDQSLLAIDVDLARFVGQQGRLTIRVNAQSNSGRSQLFWIDPRIGPVS